MPGARPLSVPGCSIGPMPAPDPTPRPEDPAPVTGETLRGDDWYGRDLTGLAYTACDFYDTDWTETTGSGARFDRCTFSGVRFNVSRLTATAFTHCEFRRCSFFDAQLDQCKAVGSTFDDCSFQLLRVTDGDWSFTSFPAPTCARPRSTASGCARPTCAAPAWTRRWSPAPTSPAPSSPGSASPMPTCVAPT
ncbi:hypothetical protein Sgou_10970 [Streptomyces gougerotii]|uniref:Pentapeptide repeat protein n=1 Tax=Streptomyces gougerotii TaxID=53448 RepID=A0ABQ1D1H8_9ACTN|nr:hypothetical protein Sgou_10970 [Streptomyces gougerotii]